MSKKKKSKEKKRVVKRLFYANPRDIAQTSVRICGDEAYHAQRVLRLDVGDVCDVFDGSGTLFHVKITHLVKDTSVEATILTKTEAGQSRPFSVSLAQAIPRKGKFDFILEKATELGVATIIPLITKRTEFLLPSHDREKLYSRWNKIILQAAKQSRHYVLPNLTDIEAIADLHERFSFYSTVLIPSPGQESKMEDVIAGLKKAGAGDVLVIIGPEGGFTQDELASATHHGATSIALGPTILKTDTAMITMIGMLNTMLT